MCYLIRLCAKTLSTSTAFSPFFVMAAALSIFSLAQVAQAAPQVPFELDADGTSHLYWPFPEQGDEWSCATAPGQGVHLGDDYYAADCNTPGQDDNGQPLRAVVSGTVLYVEDDCRNGDTGTCAATCGTASLGNQVVIVPDEDETFAVRYAHLREVYVAQGQHVVFGETIGTLGCSGLSCAPPTTPHLHIALYKNLDTLVQKRDCDGQTKTRQARDWLATGKAPKCISAPTGSGDDLVACPPTTEIAARFELDAGLVGMFQPDPSSPDVEWREGPSEAFENAYWTPRMFADNERRAFDALGSPVNPVHCWSEQPGNTACENGVWIQDFYREDTPRYGAGDTAIILSGSGDSPSAYLVREGFWGYYKENHGYRNLGAPMGDESEIDPNGLVEQRFARGVLRWRAGDEVRQYTLDDIEVGRSGVQIVASATHEVYSAGTPLGLTPLNFDGCAGCTYSLVASPAAGIAAAVKDGGGDRRFSFTLTPGLDRIDLDTLPVPPDPYLWDRHFGGTIRPRSVVYANGVYGAVGLRGTILKSIDGRTWSVLTTSILDEDTDLHDLTYANGRWVAVGEENIGGVILHSEDLVNWTKLPHWYADDLQTIGHARGRWVALGETGIFHSTDLATWTSGRIDPIGSDGSNFDFTDVTFDDVHGRFIAVSDSGRSDSLIATSADGQVWAQNAYEAFGVRLRGVASADGVTVAVGYKPSPGGPIILRSNDGGITWADVSPANRQNLFDVVRADGRWIAVGARAVAVSETGSVWNMAPNNLGAYLTGVAYAADRNELVAIDGAAMFKALPEGSTPRWQLTVETIGPGEVNFSFNTCPDECVDTFSDRSVIPLVPSPDPGYKLDSWLGSCHGDGECRPVMTQNHFVTAKFIPKTRTLTATVASGEGRLVSTPAGLDCSGTCSAPFDTKSTVKLEAVEVPGWRFDRWSGVCSSSGTLPECNVFLEQDAMIEAHFIARDPVDPNCTPPASDDWVIDQSCTLESAMTAPANVIVEAGVVLTIEAGAVFEIDFRNHRLLIRQGGGVLVRQGGTLRQTP